MFQTAVVVEVVEVVELVELVELVEVDEVRVPIAVAGRCCLRCGLRLMGIEEVDLGGAKESVVLARWLRLFFRSNALLTATARPDSDRVDLGGVYPVWRRGGTTLSTPRCLHDFDFLIFRIGFSTR